MSTATISEQIGGDKLYQKRARAALPLLVRQAEAGNTIYYSDLAAELGMPNPRNLNYVLGSIGQNMETLSKSRKERVPPIQCLVVNRGTGLPGEGVGWFLVKKDDFAALPLQKQRAIVRAELQHVFAYPYWKEVLEELALKPAPAVLPKQSAVAYGSGGESPAHKTLKEFVSKNPVVVGLPAFAKQGETEMILLSGDALDVSFETKKEWLGVEVKSRISSVMDIQRGLFQCIKYKAVMQAQAIAQGKNFETNAVLVLESSLPAELKALRNLLGIEVIENVVPKKG